MKRLLIDFAITLGVLLAIVSGVGLLFGGVIWILLNVDGWLGGALVIAILLIVAAAMATVFPTGGIPPAPPMPPRKK